MTQVFKHALIFEWRSDDIKKVEHFSFLAYMQITV